MFWIWRRTKMLVAIQHLQVLDSHHTEYAKCFASIPGDAFPKYKILLYILSNQFLPFTDIQELFVREIILNLELKV